MELATTLLILNAVASSLWGLWVTRSIYRMKKDVMDMILLYSPTEELPIFVSEDELPTEPKIPIFPTERA